MFSSTVFPFSPALQVVVFLVMVSFPWEDVFLVLLLFFLFGEIGGTYGLLANTVVRTYFFFLAPFGKYPFLDFFCSII